MNIGRKISPSEFGVSQHYPMRLRWHVDKVLDGLYGVVLRDMRSLPVVEEATLTQLEETYKWLAHYYQEGTDDPERRRIQIELGRKLMELLRANAAQIEMEDRPQDTRCRAVSMLRAYGLDEHKIEQSVRDLAEDESRVGAVSPAVYFEQVDRLFALIWTSPQLSHTTEQALTVLLESGMIAPLVAQSIVGALFVGLMEYFDATKVRLLLAFWSHHGDAMVRGAALAALLFVGRRHQVELTRFYPELVEEVHGAITRNDALLREALKVVHVSYKTTENHKIFKEKILPELRSISDRLNQMMGGGSLSGRIDELQRGMMDQEKSREVEELMAKAPEKFALMQEKDQDVAYHLVAQLKGFAFFSKVGRWFMRFDANHPELSEDNVKAFMRLLPMMSQGGRMVSSDLYSYALVPAWSQVGESMSAQMMGQSMPQPSPQPAPTEIDGVKELIFGAYRFYHLSSLAHTMVSPFGREPYLLDGAFISQRGSLSEESLLSLASMMVSFGQYGAAGRTYERVVCDYMTNTAEVWRGMAVASLMRNDDERALAQLYNAVELEGKTPMTVQKIGELLARLGRPDEALTWLAESEDEVGDYRMPLMRAEILYKMDDFDNALKAVYKADYLAEVPVREVKALLVELLLNLHRPEEAKEVLERVADSEGDYYFYRSLVAFAMGDRKSGFDRIREWLVKSETEHLAEISHLEILEQYGYSRSDRALILDVIYGMMNK